MPTSYDEEFIDGFDKYGPPGMTYPSFENLMVQGEWTTVFPTGFSGTRPSNLVTPPDGSSGCALAYFLPGPGLGLYAEDHV